MAWPRAAWSAFSLVVLLSLTACASTGREFKHANVPTLEFGTVTSTDYQAIFGQPPRVYTTTNADGKFEGVSYRYGERKMDAFEGRVLHLEFRNGTLNAWIYNSSFAEDRTSVDTTLAQKIRKGVDGKQGVQTILGKPHGKARCPSLLPEYKDHCKGTEAWAWTFSSITGMPRRQTSRFATLYVYFDAGGIATDVETTESVQSAP